MRKKEKIEYETDNWTDEDFASIWYLLFQNSMNSNIGNRALVTKRYAEIKETTKRKLYSVLKKR